MINKNKIFVVSKTPKGLDKIISVKPDIAASFYSAVINVSDSPCASFDYQLKVPSFWFPINEIAKWEYSPFYGAMKVVNEYWKGDKPILIHCHAGANRSPSIAYAILLAKGYTEDEAEKSLNYPDLREVFERNIDRGHIPKNIIKFLQMVDEHPDDSLHFILRKLDCIYEEWSRKKHDEQSNYLLSGDAEKQVRLVYSKEKKRYIITKD